MRKIQASLKPERISFLILVLPYLAFSIPVFAESPFFSLPKFLLTLIVIVLIDQLVKAFLKRYLPDPSTETAPWGPPLE